MILIPIFRPVGEGRSHFRRTSLNIIRPSLNIIRPLLYPRWRQIDDGDLEVGKPASNHLIMPPGLRPVCLSQA